METTEHEIAFVWKSMEKQFPPFGKGIHHFKNQIEEDPPEWVDCLLYYGSDNKLEGILNYLPCDGTSFQKKGSISIHVREDKRRMGIATKLLNEALLVYDIDLYEQDYTDLGKLFIEKYIPIKKK